MFTGLVEETGRLVARIGGRYRFGAARVLEGTQLGDSIAVNGCCLTVVGLGPDWFEADVVEETLERTTLDFLGVDARVNLERSLAVGDRLGGHFVQGHVDGRGVVLHPAPALAVLVPRPLSGLVALKGSIAIDGVSLTIAGR